MKNIQKIDGEYEITLPNGLIAGYQLGGYWHVINSNLDLIAGWITKEQVRELSNTIRSAHSYYAQKHEKHGMQFDHCVCVEDIHEMFGEEIAKEVNNSIASDIPELGIQLIK
jgi:hypothetical protein